MMGEYASVADVGRLATETKLVRQFRLDDIERRASAALGYALLAATAMTIAWTIGTLV